jgi:hypothetical protein
LWHSKHFSSSTFRVSSADSGFAVCGIVYCSVWKYGWFGFRSLEMTAGLYATCQLLLMGKVWH